jgi:hypothetical protein
LNIAMYYSTIYNPPERELKCMKPGIGDLVYNETNKTWKKKGKDSKKNARKVMTKGTSSFKPGGKKEKRDSLEPTLIEEEWGDLSLAFKYGTHF